jgi:hypothetical protein
MVAFLALSLLLHALFLALLLRLASGNCRFALPTGEVTSLVVQLMSGTKPSASLPLNKPNAVSHAVSGSSSVIDHRQSTDAEDTAMDTLSSPEMQGPSINLDAAFASARSIGKEAKASSNPGRPPTPKTSIESAIAKAFVSGNIVETRGADGEWVYQNGKLRCVSPVRIGVYMQGVTLMPLCTFGQ